MDFVVQEEQRPIDQTRSQEGEAMNVEYRFDSLAAVGEYFHQLGQVRRQSAIDNRLSQKRKLALMVEASTWESAADVLRKCIIVEGK